MLQTSSPQNSVRWIKQSSSVTLTCSLIVILIILLPGGVLTVLLLKTDWLWPLGGTITTVSANCGSSCSRCLVAEAWRIRVDARGLVFRIGEGVAQFKDFSCNLSRKMRFPFSPISIWRQALSFFSLIPSEFYWLPMSF